MIGIYKITSPTGKIYIGQSVDIERRKSEHRYCPTKGKLRNSFIKHGFDNHDFKILEECEVGLLNERERYYQDLFDVLGPNGLNLVLTSTSDRGGYMSKETKEKIGIGNKGKIVSNETRSKISKVHKNKIVSIETKDKLRVINTGKTLTLESRQKLSVANKGKIISEEHKQRLRDFNTGSSLSEETKRKISLTKSRKVINTETGEIFGSVKEAAESIGMKYERLTDRLRGSVKNNTNLKYL